MSRFMLFAGGLRRHSWIRVTATVLLSSLPLLIGPAVASAQNGPPLRVLLLPRLIPDAIRQMLPLMFDSPGGTADLKPQKISVVAMIYCGGDSTAGGYAAAGAYTVGVAVPGPARALSYAVLSERDCTAPLANVATRLMGTGAGPE